MAFIYSFDSINSFMPESQEWAKLKGTLFLTRKRKGSVQKDLKGNFEECSFIGIHNNCC
jgi:hypothetical protein